MRKTLAFAVPLPTNFTQSAMRHSWIAVGLLVLVILWVGLIRASAGDSFYGKAVAVKSADLVTLNNGSAQFDIRIVGIDVPREGPAAERAKEFVSKLLLGKNARARLGGRKKSQEMIAQLLTADPEIGIKDVGVELVRAGLARRQQGNDTQFGYKYGELSAAEREARRARRGIWATQPR
jgi:endonuclease YncB( thermonuclease family)